MENTGVKIIIVGIKINGARGIGKMIFKILNVFILIQLLGISVELSNEQMKIFECSYIKYFIISIDSFQYLIFCKGNGYYYKT